MSKRHSRDRRANRQIDRQLFESVRLPINPQHRIRQRRDEFATTDQIVAQMNRKRRDGEAWQLQPAHSKRFHQKRVTQCIERRHDPRRIDQVGKLDMTTTRPFAFFAGDERISILEQDFCIQLLAETTLHGLFREARQYQIDLAFLKLREFHRRRMHRHHLKSDARMVLGKALENRDKKSCCKRFRTSDLQLAGFRIGNELDVANSLPQLIECGAATRQDRFATLGPLISVLLFLAAYWLFDRLRDSFAEAV